jgi:hypothetical protein
MIEGKPGNWLRVAPAPGKSGDGRRLPIAKPRRSGVVAAAQRTEWAALDRFAEAGIRGGPFGRSLPWPRG